MKGMNETAGLGSAPSAAAESAVRGLQLTAQEPIGNGGLNSLGELHPSGAPASDPP